MFKRITQSLLVGPRQKNKTKCVSDYPITCFGFFLQLQKIQKITKKPSKSSNGLMHCLLTINATVAEQFCFFGKVEERKHS